MTPPRPVETGPIKFRLFVALPVPDSVKAEIERAQGEMHRALPGSCARWTRPEQWHLTLKFLGEVAAERTGAVTEAVRAVAEKFAPLHLRAERIGCFPDFQRPRVIWAGVRDDGNQLAALAGAIEDATAVFTSEAGAGRFTGHVTVARIKNIRRPQAELLSKLARDLTQRVFGEWTADAIEILRSELAAGGAIHTCLARLPLKQIHE